MGLVKVCDGGDYRWFRVAEFVGLEDVVCQFEDIFVSSGVKLFVR